MKNVITREQMLDISNFLNKGTQQVKKNLIIGSQEMSRLAYTPYESFVKEFLSVEYLAGNPDSPLNGASYNAGVAQPTKVITDEDKYIEGVGLARGLTQLLLRTGIEPLDNDPIPALVSLYTGGAGIATVAFKYNEDEMVGPAPIETTMGTATSTLTRNVIYLGVDWRHFADGEQIIRAVMDYLNKNNGDVIPVELLSFDADYVNNKVVLAWETASEYNSSHFEVERALVNESGVSSFAKIAEQDAAGQSSAGIELRSGR